MKSMKLTNIERKSMSIGLLVTGKTVAKNISLCIQHITDCYTPYNKKELKRDYVIQHITKSLV